MTQANERNQGEPQTLTAAEVAMLEAARASLREWIAAHRDALTLADVNDALGSAEWLLDYELDPEELDTTRRLNAQLEQRRAERNAERRAKRKAKRENAAPTREQMRRRLQVVRDGAAPGEST